MLLVDMTGIQTKKGTRGYSESIFLMGPVSFTRRGTGGIAPRKHTGVADENDHLTDPVVLVESKTEENERPVVRLFRDAINNVYVVAIAMKKSTMDIIGILKDTHFIMIGCEGSHPFIICNECKYDNSDGSGPEVFENVKWAELDAKTLVGLAKRLFEEFSQDDYH